MIRKRALRGVVALLLVLGLFAATGAQAAEGPSGGLTGFWTSVEVWFQDLVGGWFGDDEPKATTSKTDDSPELLSPTDPFGPGSTDGSGGTSTTDEGGTGDPNG